jgi:hypothetical protein
VFFGGISGSVGPAVTNAFPVWSSTSYELRRQNQGTWSRSVPCRVESAALSCCKLADRRPVGATEMHPEAAGIIYQTPPGRKEAPLATNAEFWSLQVTGLNQRLLWHCTRHPYIICRHPPSQLHLILLVNRAI